MSDDTKRTFDRIMADPKRKQRFDMNYREFLEREAEMEQKENGRVMYADPYEFGRKFAATLTVRQSGEADYLVHIFTPTELSALKEAVAREAFEAARQFVPHIVQDECFGPMEMMRHKYPTANDWWAQREKGEGHE